MKYLCKVRWIKGDYDEASFAFSIKQPSVIWTSERYLMSPLVFYKVNMD